MKLISHVFYRILLLGIIIYLLFFNSFAVFGSDVSEAKWKFNIGITNTNSTATNVATVFTLNTASLIAQGFCNSSANDTAIISSGSDFVFMPGNNSTNPWVTFIPSIATSSSKSGILYTKDATGGKIAYFPGSSGMYVYKNSLLSIGNSGNFTFNIFFNPASTGYLVNKNNDIAVRGNGSGNITASALGTGTTGITFPVIASSNNGSGVGATNLVVNLPAGYEADDLLLITLSGYNATSTFTFTPPSGWTQLYNGVATPDSTKYYRGASWYRVAGGTEGASVTFTASVAVSWSYCSLRIKRYTFTDVPVAGTAANGASTNPDPPSLTSGFGSVDTLWLASTTSSAIQTTYSTGFTLTSSAGAASYYTYISYRNETGATNNPDTWSTPTVQWISDTIAIKGSGAMASVVSPVVTAAEHTIQVYLEGGNLGIKIDGDAATTTAYAGSILNSINPFFFLTSDIALYCNYIKVYKSGSLNGYWYWQYGANFTDMSGHTNIATPTFRTTSSNTNVSASVLSSSPTSMAVASSPEVSATQVLEDIEAPPQMYLEGDYDHVPGADVINEILDVSEIPRALWWFPFIFIGIGIIGMLVFDATKTQGGEGSLLTQVIVCDALLFLFAIMGPIMLWCGILFWVPAGALIISRKHYGWG